MADRTAVVSMAVDSGDSALKTAGSGSQHLSYSHIICI